MELVSRFNEKYDIIYTARHIANWNRNDSIILKKEIDDVIAKYNVKGIASNYIMYYHLKDMFPNYPKYVWHCVESDKKNMEVSKKIMTDPNVVCLLLDYSNIDE